MSTLTKDVGVQLYSVLDSINDGVFIGNENHEIIFMNRSLREEFGDAKGELCYGFYGRSKPCPLCPLGHITRGGEKRFRYTDLEKGRCFEITANHLKNPDGSTWVIEVIRDVTESEKIEDALKKSEEKFRNIFESANDCVIYLDRSGRILDVNEKAVEVFGGSKKELLGKHFMRVGIFSLREIPTLMSAFANILAGKKANLNICIKNKKGQEIPLECSASLMKVDGKVVSMLVIARDVTERKKAEEALRESEERLRQLIEYAPDAIYVNDLQGNFIDGNRQAENLVAYKKDELIGKNLLKVGLLPKRYVPKATKALMKNLLGQRTGPDEFELIRKDGRRVTVEISTFPVKKGGKVEVIGIARDITERKEAERRIRESEERYRNLFENAADAIFTLDLKGNVTSLNKVALDYGYKKDEILGKSMFRFIPKKYWPMISKQVMSLARGKPVQGEFEVVTKKGKMVTEYRSAPIKKEGKIVGFQTIVRDITERKEMEEKLEEYSRHLEKMVEERTRELKKSHERLLRSERLAAIGELAAMVGHDLRNPLQSITNAVYVMRNFYESLPAEVKECTVPKDAPKMLQIIQDEVAYANNIVSNLQDFARVREPDFQDTDLNSVIHNALSKVKIPGNIKVMVRLDNTIPRLKMTLLK